MLSVYIMPKVKPGRRSEQGKLEDAILRLLESNAEGLHFSAIQRGVGIKSPNRVSNALRSLLEKRAIRAQRLAGPGIGYRIFQIADKNKVAVQLSTDRVSTLVDQILTNPSVATRKIRELLEEIDELRFAVSMLEDAAGVKVRRGGTE